MAESATREPVRAIGRYTLHVEIASGGMATIHLGRLNGLAGFARTVAIKRLHATFAKDPGFVAMFMDEARLAARVQHPNVVSVADVVAEQGELLLVMDYIHGESLSRLLEAEHARGGRIDPRKALKIMTDVLAGLHAAHEARNERGMSLGIVHRDVSPQNILVASDGVAKLVDFGIAKAVGRSHNTTNGDIKGKLRYMAPEQLRGAPLDRRTDIYAATAVLWEVLTGRQLFAGDSPDVVYSVLTAKVTRPTTLVPSLPEEVEAIVMKGLERDPAKRFSTAQEMSDALEAALAPATSREIGRWVQELAGADLQLRAKVVADMESQLHLSVPPAPLLALADSESGTDGSHSGARLKRSGSSDVNSIGSDADVPADTRLAPSHNGVPRANGELGRAHVAPVATDGNLYVGADAVVPRPSRLLRWGALVVGTGTIAAMLAWTLSGHVRRSASTSHTRPSAAFSSEARVLVARPSAASGGPTSASVPAAQSGRHPAAGTGGSPSPASVTTSPSGEARVQAPPAPAAATAPRPVRPQAATATASRAVRPQSAPSAQRKDNAPSTGARRKVIYTRD